MRDSQYPYRLRGQGAPQKPKPDSTLRRPLDDPRRQSLGVAGTYWKQPIRYD